MNENHEHFVEYENYCKYCTRKDEPESNEFCDRCLGNPVNTDSRRPTEFDPTKEFLQKEKIRKERERLASRSRLKNKTVN